MIRPVLELPGDAKVAFLTQFGAGKSHSESFNEVYGTIAAGMRVALAGNELSFLIRFCRPKEDS